MLTITRSYTMPAQHRLTGMRPGHPDGQLHSHDYRVEVTIRAALPLGNGMVLNTDALDTIVLPVLNGEFRNTVLNDCDNPCETGKAMAAQPSIENVALHVAFRLGCLRRGDPKYRLANIRVRATDDLWCDVSEPLSAEGGGR